MNGKQLKAEHKRLNEKEPFTAKEQKQFDKKDRSMIRNIQILNKINKKEAISVIRQYKGNSKKVLKRLADDYRKRIKKDYGQKKEKPTIHGAVRPKQKRLPQRTKSSYQENRKAVVTYLRSSNNKKESSYKRIEKGSKKYIDASLTELRYGVNSKRSQRYRERNGLSAKYEGRIVK